MRRKESGDAAGQAGRTDGQNDNTRRAPGTNSGRDAGQICSDSRSMSTSILPEPESDGAGQYARTDNQAEPTRSSDLPAIIADLAEMQVSRLRFIRTQIRIDNAAAALPRRALGWRWDMDESERTKINKRAAAILSALYADKPTDEPVAALVAPDIGVYRAAREPIVEARHEVEKAMRKLAHRLHVWPWVESVRGFGDLALAVIVAEAGDLSGYPDVDKLWKRFGLTPYKGQAASTWRLKGGLTAEEWSQFGYKPARNAETFAVLGDPLFRQQTMVGGAYRAVYDREKARFLEAGKTKMHAHRHGLRCMRKAAIEDLWRVWNGSPPKERPALDQDWCTNANADLSSPGAQAA